MTSRAQLVVELLDDRINPTPLVTSLNSNVLYVDSTSSPALTSLYVGAQVAGDGVLHRDVYAQISNFSAGISLASGAPDTVRLGDLSASGALDAYFYVTTTATATPQTYTVTYYNGRPFQGSVLATYTQSIQSVSDTIKAAANKFDSGSIVGPATLAIGSTFNLVINGETGTIGTPPIFAYTPASLPSWLPGAFQLVGTSLSFHSAAGVTGDPLLVGTTVNDALYYQAPTGAASNTAYTITYTFRAINSTSTSTSLSPITDIQSGSQVKHTDTGSWASLPVIPSVVNNLTVGMTAGAVSNGTSTVTLTVTNTGSVAASLDQLRAVLPAGISYMPGSSTLNGAAYTDPAAGTGGSSVWSDNFTVPVNGTLTLTFQVSVPATGTYQLSGFAKIGDTQIDTTARTDDNAPAVVTLAADSAPPDTAITASPPALSNSSSATFSFTGTDNPGGSGVVRFEYRIDGGTWTGVTAGPVTLTGLADGSHTFDVRAIDAVGNTDPTPATYTWTVDTTAPAAPAINGITPDTGSSATDRVTSTGSVTVAGTAEPGSTVRLFDNGSLVGTTTADGSGNWSVGVTLAEGSHPLTATATDAAGNTSVASPPASVVVDLTPPDTAITGQPTLLSASSSATFTFTGTDPGGSGVTSFEYQLDGGPWTAGASPLTLTGLTDGGHTFRVRAIDVAGNTDPTSASYSWTVDTTAPVAPAVTGFAPDTGVVGDRITAATTLTLSGTAEPNSTVTLYVDGAAAGTTTTDGAGNWTKAGVGPLADGPHAFTATATDAAGNTSGRSGSLTVTIDSTAPAAPAITAISPDTGASPTDLVTNTGTLTVRGTAEANSTVAVSDGGTFLGSAVADGAGNWSLAATLAEGTHPLTATATDASGNTSSASNPTAVVVDLTAPTTTLTGHPNAIDGSASATFTFTGSDPGGSGVAGFAYSLDGGAWTAATSPLTLTGLADGPHTFRVRAIDVAGNTDLAGNSGFNWTVDTTVPSAAAVTAVSPDTGASPTDQITAVGALTLSGTAEANSTVTLYRDGSPVGTTAADGAGNWTFDATGTPLADGVYSFTATATDAAGNTSPAGNPLVVTVDTVPPTVGATAPAATNSTTPTVSVTASDALSGVPDGTSVAVDVDLDGDGTFTGPGEAGYGTGSLTGGSAAVTLPAMPEGAYSYRVRVADVAGNTGTSATGTFRVDTTTPDTTITANPPALSGSSSATFAFTGSDTGSGVAGFEYRLDGGNWSAAGSPLTLSGLADGTHTFDVRAIDAAGNADTTPATYTWLIDTAAPAAPAITGITPDTGASATDLVTRTGTLAVRGTAEANSTVKVYDGGVLLGTATADAGGNWSLPTTLAEATHPLTATATDATGNTSPASPAAAVTVDLTAPTTTLTATPPAIDPSASATFGFTGTDGSGSGVAGFEYNLDGGAWLPTASPLTLSGLSDGPHTLSVRAMDVAGNPDSSGAAGYSWTVDTTAPAAPAITGITPDTGASPTDRVTDTGGLTVRGTAEPGATVTVSDGGGSPLGTATADAAGNWSLLTPLAEATHPLSATATDAAGNTSPASATAPVVVDLTAPGTTLTGHPAVIDGSASATFTFTGSDGTGSGVAGFEYQLDGGSWTAASSPLTLTGLTDGPHTFSVRAVDVAGNPDPTATAGFSWTVDTAPPAAPVITGISPDTGASPTDLVTGTGTLTVSGTAEANATVSAYDGTTFLGTATADAAGNWSLVVSLSEATHPLTATATDAAGNTSGPSADAPVVVDTTAPTTPTIGGPSASGSTIPTLTGTAEPGSTVSVYDGTTLLGTATAAADGSWSFTPSSPLAEGPHTITTTATDVAGNTGPASPPTTFTISTTVAVLPASTPDWTVGGPDYPTRFQAAGTLAPFTFTLKAGTSLPPGLTLDPVTGDVDGSPTAAGDFAFTVVATDPVGNAAERDFTIHINPAMTSPLGDREKLDYQIVQTAVDVDLHVVGGTGAIRYAVTAGALPPGLALDPATGRVTGTPTTRGAYFFTVTATDGVNAVFSKDYELDVLEFPLLTSGGVGAPSLGSAPQPGEIGTRVNLYGVLDGNVAGTATPFAGFTGEVLVAYGDTTGDRVPEIVTGAGVGGGPRVVVMDIQTGTELTSFFAYDSNFRGGLTVAVGDLNGDGVADIVTGAGEGGAAHVKVFDGKTHAEIGSFLAFEAAFRGGCRVAVADVNGDGVPDIVVGAGVGGGPRVQVFDGKTFAEVASWFAFESTFRGGTYVAAGDLYGTGGSVVAAGAGPGGGPRVGTFDPMTGDRRADYFAYAPGFTGGVRVAVNDATHDGTEDLITGAGPGGGPHVRVWGVTPGVRELESFFAFDSADPRGVYVS